MYLSIHCIEGYIVGSIYGKIHCIDQYCNLKIIQKSPVILHRSGGNNNNKETKKHDVTEAIKKYTENDNLQAVNDMHCPESEVHSDFRKV